MVIIPAPILAASPIHHPSANAQTSPTTSNMVTSPLVSTPDFSITTNPTSLAMTPGQTHSVTITATSLNGFVGTVYTSSFAIFLDVSPHLASFPLTAGGSASSNLTVTVPTKSSALNETLLIEATGGCTLLHFADVPITVVGPDFTITSEKSHLTVSSTVTDTAKIDLASKNGFSGSVSLIPEAFEFMVTPPITGVTLSPGGTATTTFTVGANPTTQPGNYSITIFGSAGSIYHTVDIQVTVEGGTFSLSSQPRSLTLVAGGATNTSTITVAPVSSFSGTVLLTPSSPTGINAVLSTTSVTLPPAKASTLTVSAASNTPPGDYTVKVTGNSGALSDVVEILVHVKGPDFKLSADPSFVTVVAGQTGCTSTLTVAPIDSFTGTVALTEKHDTGLTVSLSSNSIGGGSGTSDLMVSAASSTVPQVYIVRVNGTSGSLLHQDTIDVIVIGPDFELTASPSSLTITAGTSQTTSIGLNSENGFTGTVTLTNSTNDPGINATLSSSTISGSNKVTLTVKVGSSVLPGVYYSVEVNATSGLLNHPLFIAITVVGPDFTLTSNPSPITFNEGTSTTAAITVNPLLGFNDNVSLFVDPSSVNLNASILPNLVNKTSYVATLSLNSTVPGLYTVDVFGETISGLLHDLTIQVVVAGPDYSVVATPSTMTIAAGSTGSSTITISPTLGFSQSVGLSVVFPPTGITATPTPSSITPSGSSNLAITVDVTVTPGTYTLTVRGTSGSLLHDIDISLTVSGFTVSATPDTLTINQGGSKNTTISVAPVMGFNGKVQLTPSAPAGMTVKLYVSSITGSGSADLNIKPNTINPGTYLVNVTGTSNLLNEKTTISVTVPAPGDFTFDATTPTTAPADGTTQATSTITVGPLNGFTGTVTLTDTVPTGVLCNFSSQSITGGSGTAQLSCTSTAADLYNVIINGTSGSIKHSQTVTFTFTSPPDFRIAATSPAAAPADGTTSATSTITVTSVNSFGGVVTLTDAVPSGLTCTALSQGSVTGHGTATVSCSATVAGSYTLIVNGTTTTTLKHGTTATFNFVDFSISATSPASVPADGTSPATSTITVNAANGFTGIVTLTDPPPAGLTCTAFNPTTITGSGTSSLACTSTTANTYTVTITGTAGTLHHTTTATFTFKPPTKDFTITATSPSSVPADDSTTATSTITVTFLHGLTGTVTLTKTVPSALTCGALSPTSFTATGTASLSCYSAASGTYTVQITGSNTTTMRTTTATFTFSAYVAPDFTITTDHPNLSIQAGNSRTATITVTPRGIFSHNVAISVSISPTGPTDTLSIATINGGSGSSTITVNVGSSVTPGTYTITITGDAGYGLTHPTTITLTVTAAPQPVAPTSPTILGLDPTLFYIIIGIIIAIIIIGSSIVIVRGRKPAKTP